MSHSYVGRQVRHQSGTSMCISPCCFIQSQNMTSRYRPQCTSCSDMPRRDATAGTGKALDGNTVSNGSARIPPAGYQTQYNRFAHNIYSPIKSFNSRHKCLQWYHPIPLLGKIHNFGVSPNSKPREKANFKLTLEAQSKSKCRQRLHEQLECVVERQQWLDRNHMLQI